MASPLTLSSPRLRSLPLTLGLLASGASLAACGDTTGSDPTGAAGNGGSPTTSTDPATGGSAGMGGAGGATTSMQGGAGGAGGATTSMQGGGGAGGVMDPWAGPVESLKELDVGDLDFNLQKGFPIPDRTLGFTLQIEGQTPQSVVGVSRLRPPVGGSVILNFAMTGHTNQAFGGIHYIGAADPQSDSADAYPVQEGTWRVTPGSDGMSGDTAHVKVWVRRTNDGAFHGGVLDVNLIIVPGAATQSYMQQVLDNFFPYAGLTKGTIDTYAADSSFSTLSDRDEYAAMLEQSAYPKAPAINLFVVDDFADSGFGQAIGVAGGIPGSPMRHGTTQSGLAYQPSGDPKYDASILMHEIGHLGGLFHTTEFQISETDPLSDTPACDPGVIQSNPDACPDLSNVMFPIAYGATAFTSAQLNVLHGSALYRGILDAGGQPSPPLAFTAPPGAATPSPFVAEEGVDPGIRAMPRSPDPLERALGALWCSGDMEKAALALAARRDVALSRSSATSATARFRAIFMDDSAPVLLRKRALGLFLKAARIEKIEASAVETILSVAGEGAPASIADRRLRAAALRLLREVRPSMSSGGLLPLAPRVDSALASARLSSDRLLAAVASGK